MTVVSYGWSRQGASMSKFKGTRRRVVCRAVDAALTRRELTDKEIATVAAMLLEGGSDRYLMPELPRFFDALSPEARKEIIEYVKVVFLNLPQTPKVTWEDVAHFKAKIKEVRDKKDAVERLAGGNSEDNI